MPSLWSVLTSEQSERMDIMNDLQRHLEKEGLVYQ
jgi:hypothetical protein